MKERMTESTAALDSDRRHQMLAAAIDVIVERGFPDTRVADVAERAGVSPALVIYYFKTKDKLLAEAMRYAEDAWYSEMARRTGDVASAAGRLEEVVAMTFLEGAGADLEGAGADLEGSGADGLSQSGPGVVDESWALWLDLWAQAQRDAVVKQVREEFDEHFRETIRAIVRDGIASGDFNDQDADDFAVAYAALLDGFAIQIALGDPYVSARRAFELAMRVAAKLLGYYWEPRRSRLRH